MGSSISVPIRQMEFVGEIKNAAVILLVAVALLHWKSLERIRQLQKELQRENEELGRLRASLDQANTDVEVERANKEERIRELADINQCMSEDVTELKKQTLSTDEKVKLLEQEKETLVSELSAKKEAIEFISCQLQLQKDKADGKLSELSEANRTVSENLTALESRLLTFEDLTKSLEAEKDALILELNEIKQLKETLLLESDERSKVLQQEKENLLMQLSQSRECAERVNEETSNTISQLTADHEKLIRELSVLKDRIVTYESNAKDLQSERDNISQQLTDLRCKHEIQGKANQDLSSQLATLKDQVVVCESRTNELQCEKDHVVQELADMRRQKDCETSQLEDRNAELLHAKETLERELSNTRATVEELRCLVLDLENKVAQSEQEKGDLRQERDATNQQLTDLRNQRECELQLNEKNKVELIEAKELLSGQLSDARATVDELGRVISDLQSKTSQLQQSRDDLQLQKNVTSQELADLRCRSESMILEYDKKNMEMLQAKETLDRELLDAKATVDSLKDDMKLDKEKAGEQIVHLTAVSEKLSEDLSRLSGLVSDFEAKSKQLQDDKELVTKELSDLRRLKEIQVQELMDLMKVLELEKGGLVEELSLLQENLTQLKDLMVVREESAREEISALTSANLELTEKLKENPGQKVHREMELKIMQQNLNQLKEEVARRELLIQEQSDKLQVVDQLEKHISKLEKANEGLMAKVNSLESERVEPAENEQKDIVCNNKQAILNGVQEDFPEKNQAEYFAEKDHAEDVPEKGQTEDEIREKEHSTEPDTEDSSEDVEKWQLETRHSEKRLETDDASDGAAENGELEPISMESSQIGASNAEAKKRNRRKKKRAVVASDVVLTPRSYFLEVSVNGTKKGRFVIETRPDCAPAMCAAFHKYITETSGNYFGSQIVKVQAGDYVVVQNPLANNNVEPKNFIRADDSRLEGKRGAVGMQVVNMKNNVKMVGNQFTIVLSDDCFSSNLFSVFGYVTKGRSVCDSISKFNPETDKICVIDCGQLPSHA